MPSRKSPAKQSPKKADAKSAPKSLRFDAREERETLDIEWAELKRREAELLEREKKMEAQRELDQPACAADDRHDVPIWLENLAEAIDVLDKSAQELPTYFHAILKPMPEHEDDLTEKMPDAVPLARDLMSFTWRIRRIVGRLHAMRVASQL